MYTLNHEKDSAALSCNATVIEFCSRPAKAQEETECKALWLTASEAETLLDLCMVSPANGGSCEQELFRKLGDYIRSFPYPVGGTSTCGR